VKELGLQHQRTREDGVLSTASLKAGLLLIPPEPPEGITPDVGQTDEDGIECFALDSHPAVAALFNEGDRGAGGVVSVVPRPPSAAQTTAWS